MFEKKRETPYFTLIRGDLVADLERLLADRPELLSERGRDGSSGLHTAAGVGKVAAARTLIQAGIDLDLRNDEGRTALHVALEIGSPVEAVLLEAGAFVDVCAAAVLDRVERLGELLDGEPSLANDRETGLSPLGWAAYGNATGAAQLLIVRGARLDDHELVCAAQVGHVAVGELLVRSGADVNAADPSGVRPLHAAVACPYGSEPAPFVRMLLQHGADPASRDSAGRTALEFARVVADEERGCKKDYGEVIAELERGTP